MIRSLVVLAVAALLAGCGGGEDRLEGDLAATTEAATLADMVEG